MPFDAAPLDAVSQALLRAANAVERGHCKNALWLGGTPEAPERVCLMGAINLAICEDAAGGPSWGILGCHVLNRLQVASGKCLWDLVDWNNAPETKGEEVAALMRRAAVEV